MEFTRDMYREYMYQQQCNAVDKHFAAVDKHLAMLGLEAMRGIGQAVPGQPEPKHDDERRTQLLLLTED